MSAVSPSIEIQHLLKRYGPNTAVDDLSLRFDAGRIHCLLGPNGAGKTTTLRSIMGLRIPSGGEIRINGVSISSEEIHEIRREIGYLPDEPVLYDHLTGREFLQFVMELYGIDRGLGRGRVEEHLRQFGMLQASDEPIRTYSQGMKKKISLMATLIPEPAILIYDEPTGALDALTARHVKAILEEYRSQGRLVLFTTHILEIAERLADRIAIIDRGRLRFSGTLEELRQRMSSTSDASLEELFVRLVSAGEEAPPVE